MHPVGEMGMADRANRETQGPVSERIRTIMRPGKAGQRESNDVSHEVVVRNNCAPQALRQITATEADAQLSGILF
jgi:hypothetical protein